MLNTINTKVRIHHPTQLSQAMSSLKKEKKIAILLIKTAHFKHYILLKQ